MTTSQVLLIEQRGPVEWVTLNRPDAGNALNADLVGALFGYFEESYIDDMMLTSPMGLRLTKEALNLGVDATSLEAAMALEDRHQSLLALTDDAVEAGRAFFEKRDPRYLDR